MEDVMTVFGSFILLVISAIILVNINNILISFSRTIDIIQEIRTKVTPTTKVYIKHNFALTNTQKLIDLIIRLILVALGLVVLYKGMIIQEITPNGTTLLLISFIALFLLYDRYHYDLL